MIELRPFQKRFLRGALADGVDTAALSIPRGNGKSTLAAYLVTRILTPDDALFRPAKESVLVAASMQQARIVFGIAREYLEPSGEYRFVDSQTRIGITHKATNTKLRIGGSNPKMMMGLVQNPWVVADEPGAWEHKAGTLMYDAIQTAQGKPGSPLRALYIGTLAPAMSGWWHDLINGGSRGSRYVQAITGDPERWDQWPEIRRCNPLTSISAKFRKKLLEERDEAREDSRLKARFLSYRLNVPTADESEVLLTRADWSLVRARSVAPRDGRPIVGLDLGGGRAWSAAVALWPNGRAEAMAVAPGIPGIDAQERRDRVPRGTYAKLVADGTLTLAEGVRVPHPSELVNRVRQTWGVPAYVVADRFRINELRDCSLPCPLEPRVSQWSDAAFDIRALRKIARDGPLSCDPVSEPMVLWSLTASMVENDKSGNYRLIKRDPSNNTGRDDVAAAMVLAAGARARQPTGPALPGVHVIRRVA